MRLLIVGGSGFVSGHLTRMALNRGHDVTVITRGSRPLPQGAHAITADRNDAQTIRAALTGRYDAVLDCICYSAEQARLDISVFAPVTSRIVVISTDSVYHPDHKTVPQTEDAPCYLTDGGYGANKRLMELAFQQECPDTLRWTIFRPGHIFGPGSELGCYPEECRLKDLIPQLRQGTPMRLVGGGHQYLLHPIYADDLVRVMLDCIDNPACFDQLFCIGGPDVLTNRRYFEILGEILGVPVTFGTIPEEGYLSAHPTLSGYLCHRYYDLSKLERTGIRLPDTDFRTGLAAQVQWLCRERGW